MRNLTTTLLALIGVLFFSCEKQYKESPEGYMYKTLESGGADSTAAAQEIMFLNLAYYVDSEQGEDSVLFNSEETGGTVYMVREQPTLTPLDKAIRGMKEGDSVSFKFSPTQFFSESMRSPVPEFIESGDQIRLDVRFIEVLTDSAYAEWRSAMQKKQMEARISASGERYESIKSENAEQLAKDIETIKAYFEENNIDGQSTEMGIHYVIKEQGEGSMPEAGDRVRVNYSGFLLDGAFFDSSIEEVAEEYDRYNPSRTYEPFQFVVGTGSVIPGWDYIMQKFNEGTEATIYIPSPFAYGDQARGDVIKANSILVFDIELVEVINEE